MTQKTRLILASWLLLLALLGSLIGGPVLAQSGVTNLTNLVLSGDMTVGDDLTVTDAATVAGDLTVTGALNSNGTSGALTQALGTENVGGLPSVATATITYTTQTDLFTVADGEVWFVHDVLVNVTANYDCSTDNCTLGIGDGNDADGLVALVDAELQAADTEGTGFAAGWQGQLAATKGAYLVDGNFVYAPSGADEGIDATVGGTTPVAGAATIYIVYTRIQ